MKKLSMAFLLSVLCPLMTNADTALITEGNTEFALELYSRLKETKENLFFSPYSISAAIAMTYAGAKGDTEKQMAETLHFTLKEESLHAAFSELQNRLNKGGKKGTYELSIANALWRQQGYTFLEKFTELLERNYGAGLKEVDFKEATEAARGIINQWVEKETHDKIKELLKPGVLNEMTRMVLTNAIYFKGLWESQFKEERTKPLPFTLLNNEKTEVPMMYQSKKFRCAEYDNIQILELPYKGNDISMFILLPVKSNGLKNLEELLSSERLKEWLQRDNMPETEVSVYLPKFRLTSEFSLKDVLKSMGMADVFSTAADFSGMTGKKDLFISEVIHKAFVDVNEEGTEAAAATAVIMTRGMSRTTLFRADHPFIFMICDNPSGSILFLGRVINPNE